MGITSKLSFFSCFDYEKNSQTGMLAQCLFPFNPSSSFPTAPSFKDSTMYLLCLSVPFLYLCQEAQTLLKDDSWSGPGPALWTLSRCYFLRLNAPSCQTILSWLQHAASVPLFCTWNHLYLKYYFLMPSASIQNDITFEIDICIILDQEGMNNTYDKLNPIKQWFLL